MPVQDQEAVVRDSEQTATSLPSPQSVPNRTVWSRSASIAVRIAPLAALSVLWLVTIEHYYVATVPVSLPAVMQSRETPDDAVLNELSKFSFLPIDWKGRPEMIETADRGLRGIGQMPGCGAQAVRLPLAASDWERGTLACQLEFGSMAIPDTLLQAYDATGRNEYLSGAATAISAFATYERSAWINRGYLWNDHAVAQRVLVLTRFWRLYRHSANYQPDVGRAVLEMAAHSEALLAKPDYFTFATNHGVMQNLALWQAALAFPALPNAAEYQDLARTRLDEQMRFYVSSEGVVLEHSAGYQAYGLDLIGQAMRYLTLTHQAIPETWQKKYDAAKSVYADLLRPDGSLPMFGDTDSGSEASRITIGSFDPGGNFVNDSSPLRPGQDTTFLPISGYTVWWDGLSSWPISDGLSQTTLAWSNIAGHGHKHADEMSVLFWAGGQTWWSNAGYWPYGERGRDEAESWAGSNAPHRTDEGAADPGSTQVLARGESSSLEMLDLKREGANNYGARRQVIHVRPDLWLVVDNASAGGGARTTTTWTSAPDVRWSPTSSPGSYLLQGKPSAGFLRVFFKGSPGMTQTRLRGSWQPFAGWQVEDSAPKAAPAIVLEQSAQASWSLAAWRWEPANSQNDAGDPPEIDWNGPEHWRMQWHGKAGSITVSRANHVVELSQAGNLKTVALRGSEDIRPAHAELQRELSLTASKYPPFREAPSRRLKLSWALLAMVIVQEFFLALVRRFALAWLVPLQCLMTVAWLMGGALFLKLCYWF